MKAMVFAAGLGTRLKPFTETRPKALVSIAGKTLLEWALLSLQKASVTDVIINIHHHPEMMRAFIHSIKMEGMKLSISDESEELLDTGGGLKKAGWFFDDAKPFLVCNVDIIHNINLREMMKVHASSGALATLAVKSRETSRYLVFDKENNLCGWQNRETGEEKIARDCGPESKPYAFSGIHVIHPSIFDFIRQEGVFSMIDLYLDLAARHRIHAFVAENSLVMDVGKPAELAEAESLLTSGFLG